MFKCPTIFVAGTLLAGVSAASAQTNIHPSNKSSWSENCGWMNWADAGSPAGQAVVVVHASYLSGFIWCENIGWINVGNGSPGDDCDGHPCYSTSNGAESGVNLDPATGELSGFAWGENVGWVNFSGGAMATPPNPARLDSSAPGADRFRGYAWGENIGWINLNLADDGFGKFVGVVFPVACPADFNHDGDVNPDDLGDYITCFFTEPPCAGADFNHDGDINPDDLGDFITTFFSGAC